MSNSIMHTGVIRCINDETITVAISAESSCGNCHTKTICGLSEVSEKLVYVKKTTENLQIGDEIQVVMDSALGTKAVVLAYILPLFILIASLFICLQFTSELIAALVAISLLVCHFFVLHKYRDKIERKFSFSIKK